MRNHFMKLGRVALVGGALAFAACSSSNGNNGTGGSSGSGGATGTGGSNTDAGADAPTGVGGAGGGGSGTGGMAGGTGGAGGGANLHQDHLNIINKTTTGGLPVTRTAPISYDSCKI